LDDRPSKVLVDFDLRDDRRPNVMRARWRQPEAEIQRAVWAYIGCRLVPGGGDCGAQWPCRAKIEAAIFVGLGVVPGVPDLIIIRGGAVFGLELKADKGRLSEAQRLVHARMQTAGAIVAVAYGLDAAVRQLEMWGLLRGRIANF
jgi:hypothetical protein